MCDAQTGPNPLIVLACRTKAQNFSYTRPRALEMFMGQVRHASTIKDLAANHASSVRHTCVTRPWRRLVLPNHGDCS